MAKIHCENNRNIYSRWFGFGLEFCGVMAVFSFLGYKLDQTFNTSPWLMIIGFFLGFAGMFYLILKENRVIKT